MEQFSYASIFQYCRFRDIVEDTIIPFLVATGLCVMIRLSDQNVLSQLGELVKVGLDVLPAMVALLFSAYAIVVTFFSDAVFQHARNKEKGTELINTLNASFCLYLLVSVFGVVLMVITSLIMSMEIEVPFHQYVNFGVYWTLCFVMTYSVVTLFGIIMDIYYCGKATVGHNQSQDSEKEQN